MKTDEQKLNIVGAAAQLLLENGSETYRVEETAQRMAKGFGMEQVNIAAFPTSVFLEADGRAYVRRISRRGTNSQRIAMVNEISREVEHGKLSAEQAQAWGMIWQVVDDEQLSATAQQMALHFASQPTYGLSLIKQAINAAETNTLDAQLDLERDYQRLAGRSDDYREGVSAFLAKRAPNFTGK